MLWPERFARQPPLLGAEALTPPLTRERTARASPGGRRAGTGTRDRTARLVVVECMAEGGLGDGVDGEELIRKRAILLY